MSDIVKRALDAAFAVGEAQADGADGLALASLVAEMNDAEAELRAALPGASQSADCDWCKAGNQADKYRMHDIQVPCRTPAGRGASDAR